MSKSKVCWEKSFLIKMYEDSHKAFFNADGKSKPKGIDYVVNGGNFYWDAKYPELTPLNFPVMERYDPIFLENIKAKQLVMVSK